MRVRGEIRTTVEAEWGVKAEACGRERSARGSDQSGSLEQLALCDRAGAFVAQ